MLATRQSYIRKKTILLCPLESGSQKHQATNGHCAVGKDNLAAILLASTRLSNQGEHTVEFPNRTLSFNPGFSSVCAHRLRPGLCRAVKFRDTSVRHPAAKPDLYPTFLLCSFLGSHQSLRLGSICPPGLNSQGHPVVAPPSKPVFRC